MKVTRVIHDTGGDRSTGDVTDRPCPAITVGGLVSNAHHFRVETVEGEKKMPQSKNEAEKPPYRVPLMSEIVKVPPNGFNVVSLFSGCGGSCTGFRMAGFKILYASEFIPAARESYLANSSPWTVMDDRDIRKVQPEEILTAIGVKRGQVDVVEMSPPCSSFSTAGKRHKGWNQVKRYSDSSQRTDDLFWEALRIVDGIRPRVFVAENVSGLVKGVAKGFFLEVLAAMKKMDYGVACKVLDAQWLGVPQMRQRTIFVGVRSDLEDADGRPVMPAHPLPLPYRYSVREAIPWITGCSHDSGGVEGVKDYDVDREPLRTVRAGGGGNQMRQRVVSNQDGEVSEDTYGEHRTYQDGQAPSIRARKPGHLKIRHGIASSHSSVRGQEVNPEAPAPTVMGDPHGNQFTVEQESDMSRFATGAEFDRMSRPGANSRVVQSDRYFQLVKAAPAEPSPTVTAEGGNAGAASVCHPVERRKFSIAELKRICAFPDDFVLTGSYAQRWERLGRAVPPVFMQKVAEVIRDKILRVAVFESEEYQE